MVSRFVTSTGTPLQLGRELGRGGEGSVFDVPSLPDFVAKLYHQPLNSEKQEKLRFMVANGTKHLLEYAAWPVDTLHVAAGKPVAGFLMPKVATCDPIHMLYSPAHRRQERPKAAWDFLLCVARNIAAAFETLHACGHVVGDVNQGNVMVSSNSKVMLIDCDSFQVAENGSLHRCEVGVSHFTPPELQGLSSFHGVTRTTNHDNFGLALLIFHLLFGGRHPYSGVPLRKEVGEALETDIKALRYAYARDGHARGITPPPRAIPMALVPDSIQAMFEAAFTERGAKGERPAAQNWVSTLDSLRQRIKKCSVSKMHVFPDHLVKCPWCELEHVGVVYFIDIGTFVEHAGSTFNLVKMWAIVEAAKVPPSPALPDVNSIAVISRPLPPGIPTNGFRALCKFASIIILVALFFSFPGGWIFWGIIGWITWAVIGQMGSSELKVEQANRKAARDVAERNFEMLKGRVRSETGPEQFNSRRQKLVTLRDEYQRLPTREKAELDALHASAEQRQKMQFLDRCFIDSATIAGVGPAKKAALRSFGIETAADVDWDKVSAVRGFGEVRTRAVVDWRKACERKFTFNPAKAVSEADRNAVRARIALRSKQLETELSSGATDLIRFSKEASVKANAFQPQLDAAATQLAQANADLRLC